MRHRGRHRAAGNRGRHRAAGDRGRVGVRERRESRGGPGATGAQSLIMLLFVPAELVARRRARRPASSTTISERCGFLLGCNFPRS